MSGNAFVRHPHDDYRQNEVPADITIRLDDHNTIELRTIDLDGMRTVGLRVIDNECNSDAACEVDYRELGALVSGLLALR